MRVQDHTIRLLVDTGFPGILLFEERLITTASNLEVSEKPIGVILGDRLRAKQTTLRGLRGFMRIVWQLLEKTLVRSFGSRQAIWGRPNGNGGRTRLWPTHRARPHGGEVVAGTPNDPRIRRPSGRSRAETLRPDSDFDPADTGGK
jgi:hypothetical protein